MSLFNVTVSPFNGAWWGLIAGIALLCLLPRQMQRDRAHSEKLMLRMGAATLCWLVVYRIALVLVPTYTYNFWEELPLQPCNVIVLLTIPAVLAGDTQGGRVLRAFCFYGGLICAPVALVMPMEGFYDVPLLSVEIAGYFIFHGMVVVLAVSFCTLGLYRPRYRDIPGAAATLALIGGAAHLLNLLMRATVCPTANFFFTFGMEGNPITDSLHRLIPVNYVFMLPLALVFAALCALITFVCHLLQHHSEDEQLPAHI